MSTTEGIALWADEREQLIEWHRRCAIASMQQDDFNGERNHRLRLEQLRCRTADGDSSGEPAGRQEFKPVPFTAEEIAQDIDVPMCAHCGVRLLKGHDLETKWYCRQPLTKPGEPS